MAPRSEDGRRESGGIGLGVALLAWCTLLGLAGDALLLLTAKTLHRSSAKLLVRHIATERDDDRVALATEEAILNSADLAEQVAAAIGSERLAQAESGGGEPCSAWRWEARSRACCSPLPAGGSG